MENRLDSDEDCLQTNPMRQIRIYILVLLSLLLFNACDQQGEARREWVSLAIEIEKYIESGKYISETGEAWKMMPDSMDSRADHTLYSGVPGIVLFYLELFNATGDTGFLRKARSGADYLINTLPDSISNPYEVGLYTGIAGVGYTLIEVYKATGENMYLEGGLKTFDLLKSSAETSPNGIHWGSINDIVYGSAGIGLYLQYLAETLDLEEADSIAVLAAEGLLDNAIDTLDGFRWNFAPGFDRYMDNFSHGTAGVAYFLARTYKRSNNEKYLNAALRAGDFLFSLTNEKGYIPHHYPGGEDLFYLSWCHGPAGTSKLYYSLYEFTEDDKWLDVVIRSAESVMNEGIDSTNTPGFWNNEGKCCGSVGVAEHYLWLYGITGDRNFLEFSNKMTDRVLANVDRGAGHLKWIHAENRVSPDEVAAQTGLMQGSAGMGLWFLRLHAFQNKEAPSIRLPDDR